MDEKKVREAIYCMKSFADDTVCEECDNYDRCDHTMVADNARIAIEALKKQLPKKLKKIDIINHVTSQVTGTFYLCKCCEESCSEYMEYCPECGQKLDFGANGEGE